jgi:hypothetical protein
VNPPGVAAAALPTLSGVSRVMRPTVRRMANHPRPIARLCCIGVFQGSSDPAEAVSSKPAFDPAVSPTALGLNQAEACAFQGVGAANFKALLHRRVRSVVLRCQITTPYSPWALFPSEVLTKRRCSPKHVRRHAPLCQSLRQFRAIRANPSGAASEVCPVRPSAARPS